MAIALYLALTAPFAVTKLNGDEAHFVTIPYLMLGGDYTLSAVSEGNYTQAVKAAALSYALAWRYYVRPSEIRGRVGEELAQFPVKKRAAGRVEPFVFSPEYFARHRSAGKPLLSFLLMAPSLGLAYMFPESLYTYQRDTIYHPVFYALRFTYILIGLATLILVYRIVRERWDESAAGRAALAFSALPVTAIWSSDLHQDVPLGLFLLVYSYFVWKRRLVLAGVFWGLAFATKNQAIFGLAPLVAEAIWVFCDAGSLRERLSRSVKPLVAFAVVFVIGIVVSAPFGHPLHNLREIVSTSAPSFGEEIQSGNALFLWMPIWAGMGFLGFLGLYFLDVVKDEFDRYQIFFLILPGFLHFFVNSRLSMLVPAAAILIGSYFRPKTFYFLLGAMMAINLYGIQEPYLTSRGIGYRWLLRDVPHEISAIEGLLGVGSIQAEEVKLERRRLMRRLHELEAQNPDRPQAQKAPEPPPGTNTSSGAPVKAAPDPKPLPPRPKQE